MKDCPTDNDSLRKDVKEELDKATRDDKALKEKVSVWRRVNRKWLVKSNKKEETKDKGEPTKPGSGKDRWLETLARDLKPVTNLQDDGDLRAMKAWKQQMMTYTSYIKKEFQLTPGLFYDIFTNLCTLEMKKKQDTVKANVQVTLHS